MHKSGCSRDYDYNSVLSGGVGRVSYKLHNIYNHNTSQDPGPHGYYNCSKHAVTHTATAITILFLYYRQIILFLQLEYKLKPINRILIISYLKITLYKYLLFIYITLLIACYFVIISSYYTSYFIIIITVG